MINVLRPPHQIVVGISDLAVSSDPRDSLVTHALGSCVGVAVHDPTLRVGGLLHFMLPSSEPMRERARTQPAMFGDTGVRALLAAMAAHGCQRHNVVIHLAGGGCLHNDPMRIGERNQEAARKALSMFQLRVSWADLGGSKPRTMWLDVGTGQVRVRSPGDAP